MFLWEERQRDGLTADRGWRISEGFLKDGKHRTQLVSRWEWSSRKGSGQICRYKHLPAASLKMHSHSGSLPHWSCWCPNKKEPPILTLLFLLSDSNCSRAPSLAVCWQNPSSHLWALSLSGEKAMADLCRAGLFRMNCELKWSWQEPTFLSSWGSSQGRANPPNFYLPSHRDPRG